MTITRTDIGKARKKMFVKTNNELLIPPTEAALEEHVKGQPTRGWGRSAVDAIMDHLWSTPDPPVASMGAFSAQNSRPNLHSICPQCVSNFFLTDVKQKSFTYDLASRLKAILFHSSWNSRWETFSRGRFHHADYGEFLTDAGEFSQFSRRERLFNASLFLP